ncbi:MAG: UbiA family prenyltransferase [Thermoproteus sp.]|nr:UbiA family prenyltransferase [Thermoproteus sp.]
MLHYWRLIRGEHGALAAMAAAASYVLAGGNEAGKAALIALSTFLAEAGMFAHNDLANLAEDRINRPDAPLVTGAVSPAAAKALAASAYLLGLASAAPLGPVPAAIYVTAVALGFFYNVRGKRVPLVGNFLVALLTSLVYPYGMAAAPAWHLPLLLLFAASLLANLGRELVKAALDYEGDRAAGVRTAAVVWGPERTASWGAYLAAASGFVGVYLALVSMADKLYVLAAGVAATTAALFASSYLCLKGKWGVFKRGALAAFGVTLAALLLQALFIYWG